MLLLTICIICRHTIHLTLLPQYDSMLSFTVILQAPISHLVYTVSSCYSESMQQWINLQLQFSKRADTIAVKSFSIIFYLTFNCYPNSEIAWLCDIMLSGYSDKWCRSTRCHCLHPRWNIPTCPNRISLCDKALLTLMKKMFLFFFFSPRVTLLQGCLFPERFPPHPEQNDK